jgi:tetratricopeptide (TPR) repeat protein
MCFLLPAVLKVNAQVFDCIKTFAPDDRIRKADSIYKLNYRHVDSVSAMRGLARLNNIAIELQDKLLAIAVYQFKADYYSVNFGYNPQSTFYYQEAINACINNGYTIKTGYYIFRKGYYYSEFKKYVPACQNYLKAYDIFKTAGFDNVPNISRYLSQIAGFYYDLGDLETAKHFLLQALNYKSPSPREEINTINTVGLIYRSSSDYVNALKYFNKALDLAREQKDLAWIGIATGNIGSVYFMEKNYAVALPYLKTDYEQSLKYNEPSNAAIALIRIAKINADAKNFDEANGQLTTVEKLIKPNARLTLKQRIDIYALRADICEKTGKAAAALIYQKKYDAAKDTLTKINDILSVESTKLQWETSKYLLKENQLNATADAERIKRNSLAGVLFLLMVISILIYSRQRLVIKGDKVIFEKQQVALQLETSRADEESNKARLALIDYTDKLRQKNDLLESFKAELDNIQGTADPSYQVRSIQLRDMMEAHIMTDKAWLEFKKLFDKVHIRFFSLIKSRFSDITETDMRMLALIKLKLSNREMAGMLGITVEGVKKAKQRLRKKTGLPEEHSLEDIIAGI